MQVYESPYVPPGVVLIGDFTHGLITTEPLKLRRKMGWKAEIRQIVRDGMADVLEWLGDNAPPPLPDEEDESRWRIIAEERLAMQVVRPDRS